MGFFELLFYLRILSLQFDNDFTIGFDLGGKGSNLTLEGAYYFLVLLVQIDVVLLTCAYG